MSTPAAATPFDYDDARQNFRWEVPEHYNFAVDTIGQWAADPEQLAMLHIDRHGQERRITFAEFAERSDRLAAGLAQRGVGPGDRVLLILPRVPEWWEAILAIMKLGAVSLPGTTLLTARDLAYRLHTSGAKAVIADAEVAERVDEAAENAPDLQVSVIVDGTRAGWVDYDALAATDAANFTPADSRSDDPCMLYFTSGTTAKPKMVLHTHASYPIGHITTGRFWLAVGPDDLHWNLSDNGWAKAAWSSLYGPWSVGAALFVHDARGKFNGAEALALFERYPITSFCGAPTIYRLLVLEDLSAFTPAALRSCVGAGEPLNPEVIATWRAATGLTIRDGYGQTETAVLVANFPGVPVRPGSMGKPTPGFDVAVIDDAGHELPPDTEGQLALRVSPVRPVGFYHGYYGEPELTGQRLLGDWYLTGDRARRDADGYYWFVARDDDVIISAGYRISPFEVESALLEHAACAESAVVGSPDTLRGHIVKAFVVLKPGRQPSEALAAELQEHVRNVTAPYMYPREVEFVSELPKTISGKIRRVELREQEAQRKGRAAG